MVRWLTFFLSWRRLINHTEGIFCLFSIAKGTHEQGAEDSRKMIILNDRDLKACLMRSSCINSIFVRLVVVGTLAFCEMCFIIRFSRWSGKIRCIICSMSASKMVFFFAKIGTSSGVPASPRSQLQGGMGGVALSSSRLGASHPQPETLNLGDDLEMSLGEDSVAAPSPPTTPESKRLSGIVQLTAAPQASPTLSPDLSLEALQHANRSFAAMIQQG